MYLTWNSCLNLGLFWSLSTISKVDTRERLLSIEINWNIVRVSLWNFKRVIFEWYLYFRGIDKGLFTNVTFFRRVSRAAIKESQGRVDKTWMTWGTIAKHGSPFNRKRVFIRLYLWVNSSDHQVNNRMDLLRTYLQHLNRIANVAKHFSTNEKNGLHFNIWFSNPRLRDECCSLRSSVSITT